MNNSKQIVWTSFMVTFCLFFSLNAAGHCMLLLFWKEQCEKTLVSFQRFKEMSKRMFYWVNYLFKNVISRQM